MDAHRRRGTGPVVEGILGDPGSLAPSVDKQWRDEFILELRLLSVPGETIGDALLTVETHVTDSGEDAAEAFGDARSYAKEISRATGTAGRGWKVSATTVASTLLGLLGMLLSVSAFSAWLQRGPVGVTTGELVGLGVVLLLACALFFSGTMRLLAEHRWLALPVPVLLVGALVGLFVVLGEPLFEVPTLPVAVAGVLLLAVSTVLSWVEQATTLDQVTAPGQAPVVSRSTQAFTALIFPSMTVLLLVFVWVLHTLTS